MTGTDRALRRQIAALTVKLQDADAELARLREAVEAIQQARQAWVITGDTKRFAEDVLVVLTTEAERIAAAGEGAGRG